MNTYTQNKLKFLHIGADPEFDSYAVFENYKVEISSVDNPFSVSQWIEVNGLPDAVICEQKIPGSNGFGFFDFWIEQFDREAHIPFILLDDEENPETVSQAIQKKIDEVFVKPTKIETLVGRILILKEIKPLNGIDSVHKINNTTPYKTPFFKRMFDIVCASIDLILISPILLLFILAIRLESRGKAFSISKRVGSGYKVFNLYKLRSMYSNADKRLKELAHLNQYHKDAITADLTHIGTQSLANQNTTLGNILIGDGNKVSEADHIRLKNENQETAFLNFENDRRITRVGQIIRKLRIDRLPQLINVIKGDMSIVGNRPLAMSEAELLTTEDWTDRFHGPAGITGLWQVKTRSKSGKMSPEERKSLDNRYYEIARSRFSFFKDIWIILLTIPAIFRKENV